MVLDVKEFQNKLWEAADKLRANSSLKGTDFSIPVLGLIFLRYADYKFQKAKAQLESDMQSSRRRTSEGSTNYHALGVLYLKEEAQYSYLMSLPEGTSVGKAVNNAMVQIESDNPTLQGILPKNYLRLEDDLIVALMKIFSEMNFDNLEGDAFGKIYEYFLGKFASSEGQKGGEFFTPTSVVKLIVEILKPIQGLILDPACGSGGMFVQSAEFVKRHDLLPNEKIHIYGQEKTEETVRLCKMNLAVHGLEGDIKQANTYYENVHNCVGKFDFVMANPPFNVNGVDKDRIKDDKRYCFGIPRNDNANYLWIQEFYSALKGNGRAGFVMANSASDARQSEQDIREKIIKEGVVDVMVSVGSNFFHNVTLPCTLWFFDKSKRNTDRQNKVLFLDVRDIFTQIDRAHREFTDEQIELIANIVKLYRGDELDFTSGSEEKIKELFPNLKYDDIAGLCKVATIDDVEKQGWSLNPGRYVGVCENCDAEDFDFTETLEALNEELELLNVEAKELEEQIADNVKQLLEIK